MQSLRRVPLCAALGLWLASQSVSAQSSPPVPFSVEQSLGTGGFPLPSTLVSGADGNVYAATPTGGEFGAGTIVRLTPAGTLTVVHEFNGEREEGRAPSNLIASEDSHLYGVVSVGSGWGVFRMTLAGAVTVLSEFPGCIRLRQSCGPPEALVPAADGSLYGIVPPFSGIGFQVPAYLFRLAPDGSRSMVREFRAGDPVNSVSAMIEGAPGVFVAVGFASSIGASIVFTMSSAGTISVVGSTPGPCPCPLVRVTDGQVYGATSPSSDTGVRTYFRVAPPGLPVIQTITDGNDGWPVPAANFTAGRDGHLYVSTKHRAYRLQTDGTVTILATFPLPGGGYGWSTLAQAADGSLFGTTGLAAFGVSGTGYRKTFYRIPPGGALAIVRSDLEQLATWDRLRPLSLGLDGALYTTFSDGGRNLAGAIVRRTTDRQTSTLYSFSGADGAVPLGPLLHRSDGALLGTTLLGGAANRGTVFSLSPGGTLTTLHTFAGGAGDGAYPRAALTRGPDGALYGTTTAGGRLDFGTIFRIAPNGAYAVIYQFAGGMDGGHPDTPLTVGADGRLYGTTPITGAYNAGTMFRVTPQGALSTLHHFNGLDPSGLNVPAPRVGLTLAGNGVLYGVTLIGGTGAKGTLFRVESNGGVRVLHAFGGDAGANPDGPLLLGRDGALYGAASDGGPLACRSLGTVFRATLDGVVEPLVSFSDSSYPFCEPEATNPRGALVQTADGNIYGTSYGGVPQLFRAWLGPPVPVQVYAYPARTDHPVLAWWPSPGATGYRIWRRRRGGAFAAIATTSASSFIDRSVTIAPGAAYDYVIQALSQHGASATSMSVAAHVVTPASTDFNGDRQTDLVVFRPSTVTWYIKHVATGDSTGVAWGAPGDVPVPGDYDGDGRSDVAVFRDNGTWYIRHSGGGAFGVSWGYGSDVPVPGDYDGDRRSDIAVYRRSEGIWYVRYSGGGAFGVAWGISEDVPVPADYDGDGVTDLVVYRPSNGTWYVNSIRTGTRWGRVWGAAGDLPAPGDYDGDGRADIAVFRPSNGTWYIRHADETTAAVALGQAGDIPAPGDYDGDGVTDVAVYSPASGGFTIRYSGHDRYDYQPWGAHGDVVVSGRP